MQIETIAQPPTPMSSTTEPEIHDIYPQTPGASAMDDALLRLRAASKAIGEATAQAFYLWDLPSDQVHWSENFLPLAGLQSDEKRHLTGRGFETMLDEASLQTRFAVISAAQNTEPGKSVPYQCIYLIGEKPNQQSVWIEDTGSWYAGHDGKPVRAEGSIRIITERRKREEALQRQSDYDDLTGLPNRRTLERRLDETIRRAKDTGEIATFIIVSIDRLDSINDVFGFDAGDEVLKTTARRIASRLRARDLVARISGAKFGIVLEKCPPAEVFDAVDRVLVAVAEETVESANSAIPVHAIAGACFIPRHGKSARETLARGFKALRHVQGKGHGAIEVYSENNDQQIEADRRARAVRTLIAALSDDALKTVTRPQFRLPDNTPVSSIRLEVATGEIDHDDEALRHLAREAGVFERYDKALLAGALAYIREHSDHVCAVPVTVNSLTDNHWQRALYEGLPQICEPANLFIQVRANALDMPAHCDLLGQITTAGCRVLIDRYAGSLVHLARMHELGIHHVLLDMQSTASGNAVLDTARTQIEANLQALDIHCVSGI